MIQGKAQTYACILGGFDTMVRLAEILGVKTPYDEPVRARINCRGGNRAQTKFHYLGAADCRAEHLLYQGRVDCGNGCLGKGSCVRACPFGAMVMTARGFPEIRGDLCRGCGRCVAVCPRGVISLAGFTDHLLHLNQKTECLPPCRQKCPAQVDVPGVIRDIRHKAFDRALLRIKARNPLVLSVGRVCAHPCENICRRNIADQGVAICQLQRFLGEREMASGRRVPVSCAPETGCKIAVIGAGPAGLSCAYFLKRLGHSPVIFEKKPLPGGMLRYGIPDYRLPPKAVDWDIQGILSLGIPLHTRTVLGRNFSLEGLLSQGYQAIFLGLGAWVVPQLCIPGESARGVIKSLDFLSGVGSTIPSLNGAAVVVVGESNTAMDCARSSIRLGAESVTVICPTDHQNMSARKRDITRAMEEGVSICFAAFPVRIHWDALGNATHLTYCQEGGGEKKIRATLVISAHQRTPDLDHMIDAEKPGPRLKATPKSTLAVDSDTLVAAGPNIFAAGDLHTGRASVIEAVAGARKAARSIHLLLTRGHIPVSPLDQKTINPQSIHKHVTVTRPVPKVVVPQFPAALRKTSFIEEVQGTITQEQALAEAARCLDCGTFCTGSDP